MYACQLLIHDSRELPYFFNGNEITVSHTAVYDNGGIKQTYFSALISIVPEKNDVDKACTKRDELNRTFWETSYHGYSSNIKCSEVIFIPQKHQVYAEVKFFGEEMETDLLKYYADEELLYPSEISTSDVYVFFQRETDINFTWTFESKENIISQGFKVGFETIGMLPAAKGLHRVTVSILLILFFKNVRAMKFS